MTRQVLKFLTIFFVISGILFSNIPFSTLSFLVDSYEKTSGIVDKIWLVQQKHNSNVVDKFASFRNFSEKFKIHNAMAAANYQAAGTWTAVGAATASPPWPAHQINDVALLFVETANQAATLTTPNGFVQVLNSPQSTGTAGAAGGTRLTVFWARATSGTMAAPVIAATTNHTTARIITFRGVIETGDPWDVTAGAVTTPANVASTFPAVTTTVPDTVIVLAAALDLDSNSTATWTSWTNANITGITERQDQTVNTGVGGGLAVATALRAATGNVNTTASVHTSSITTQMTIALKPQLTTTLATDTDPAATTIAPGAAATDVDLFNLTTTVGTETVNSVTVNLSNNAGIGTLAITNNANTVLGSIGGGTGAGIVTGSNAITVSGMSVGTTLTTFKVRATPLAHTSMPAPAGGSYTITAPVTSWAGTPTYTHTGSDTNPNALTIDNTSPGGTTGLTPTAGNTQVDLSWSNPGDADFQQIYIYCKTSSMIAGEAPTEGTDPAVDATACDGTARMKYKGSASPQTISSLANGTPYYFRIYARDTRGNFTAFATTQEVNATPAAAAPDATSFTDDTETGLNNLGGRTGQTITISGTNFGTAAGGSRATCGGGAGTGCVQIGAYTIPDGNFTVWNPTTITFSIPAAITSYGTTVTVRAANQADGTPLTFKVYPNITAISPGGVGEAKEGDTITITGTRFGTTQGANKVTIDGVSATITGWTDTSIDATVPSAINDANNSVAVRAYQGTEGDNTIYDDSAGFIVLPAITGTTDLPTAEPDAAREYNAADTQGVFTVLGNHFGAAGTVTIHGQTATQVTTATCAGTAYQATCIGLQVPATIANNSYTGNIVATRTADTKVNTYAGFRVLPRIASTAPINLKGGRGDTISITGDHLCQSGVCPSAFSAANSANFNGGSVTSGASTWTDTSIPSIVIPAGAIDGNLNITSNTTYISNNLTYDVKFAPTTPTNGVPAGQTGVGLNPTLNGNAFSDGTDGDTHNESEWQVDEEGTFATPEWAETLASANTSVAVNNTNGTFAGLLAGQTSLACGKTYSFRIRYKDNAGVTSQEFSSWSTTSTFDTVSCGPDATSVSYQVGGDGGRSGYSATISGSGFGTVAGGSRASCAGGAGTGCIRFTAGGNATVADGDITAWTNTSITFTVNSTLASEGGASNIEVVAAAAADPSKLTFYVYPTISGFTAAQTDGDIQTGTITISGDHLGSAGAATNISFNGTNPGSIGTWTSTSIPTVDIPNAGTDSGTITITRASDSKASNASATFYIYPQLTGYTATQSDGDIQTGTITISGNHFGSGGAGTNISVNGANPGSVGGWTSTSLTTVDIPNAGTDSGTITVTNPGTGKNSNTSSTFYIYPQITSLSVPTAEPDAAREYSGTDSDGTITTVSGNHFGTPSGTNPLTILGTDTSGYSGWAATAVSNVQVPTAISDSSYTGSIVLKRTDNKTATYAGFRVLPRITSLTPNSGLPGVDVTVAGNHLCQTGACPTATNWNTAADDGHDVEWGTTDATILSTPAEPTHTTIYVDTPSISAGPYSVTVTSGGGTPYVSNALTHTISANNPPAITVSQPDGVGDSVTVGNSYNITYDLSDTEDTATVDFYYDTDAVGLNGTAIAGCQNQIEGAGATCSWDTTGVPLGDYYVYGIADDTVNPTSNDYSSGVLSITGVPQITAASLGTQLTNIDAGDATTDYVGAAFTFQKNNGAAENITALTISEMGTINANSHLSTNAGIRYESNVATCTYNGTETLVAGTFNVSDQMVLSGLTIPVTVGANVTCIYVVFDVSSSAVGGQTIDLQVTANTDFTTSGGTTKVGTYPVQLSGTTTVRPNVTSFSNDTEPALADGGRETQTISISGAGFGTTCNTGTGYKVSVGAYDLPCTSATFNNTTISIPIAAAISDNNNGGAGASGMLVTIGSTADDTRQTFYVYPTVTSLTVPTADPDAAREYSAFDSDGLITINGNHFGTPNGTNPLTFLGTNTSGYISWADTAITSAEIPTGISDSIYTGSIVLTRNDSKGYTYAGFRVLPRVTSLTPNSDVIGTDITIAGSHLCQSGACLTAANINSVADDGDDVEWGTTDAVVTGTPGHSTVHANVPNISSGVHSVTVTSNGYVSNGQNFTIISSEPFAPTNLYQFKTKNDLAEPPAVHDPLTNANPDGKITTGGGINQTNSWLRATADAPVNNTLCIEVEVKPTASAFDGTGVVLSADADGCKSFTGAPVTLFVNAPGLSDGTTYKWRSRIKNNGTGVYGAWTNAPVDGSSKSFYVDTTAPTIVGCPLHSNVTSSGATIQWTPSDSMSTTFTKQVQYDDDSAFGSSICTPGATCGTPTSGLTANPQSVAPTALGPNTTYYYRVRSKDPAGNEGSGGYGINGDSSCMFTTSKAETRTTEFYVTTKTGLLTGGSTYSPTFTVYIPENGYAIQSAFIEMSGIMDSDSDTTAEVEVWNNSQTSSTYTIKTSNSVNTPFSIIHYISSADLNVSTPTNPNNTNTLNIRVPSGSDPDVSIASAKIVVTYYHTPVQP